MNIQGKKNAPTSSAMWDLTSCYRQTTTQTAIIPSLLQTQFVQCWMVFKIFQSHVLLYFDRVAARAWPESLTHLPFLASCTTAWCHGTALELHCQKWLALEGRLPAHCQERSKNDISMSNVLPFGNCELVLSADRGLGAMPLPH